MEGVIGICDHCGEDDFCVKCEFPSCKQLICLDCRKTKYIRNWICCIYHRKVLLYAIRSNAWVEGRRNEE